MKNIAFITKSERFAPLIQAFRKSAVNAEKREVNRDLSSFDVLIIDLGYPLEQAYPLLEKINNDFNFSDKIIISVISHKSQITKLRTTALGSDAYISSTIEYSDLLKKIKEIDDPEKFLIKKDFENIATQIKYEGSLTHISENGCLIKSKVSLANDVNKLNIQSKIFKDLGLEKSIECTLSRSNPIAKRSFITEVHFSDFSENERHNIRKMVHSWSTK